MDFTGQYSIDDSDYGRSDRIGQADVPFTDALSSSAEDAWVHNPSNALGDLGNYELAQNPQLREPTADAGEALDDAGSAFGIPNLGSGLDALSQEAQSRPASADNFVDPHTLNQQYGQSLGLSFDQPMRQGAVDILVAQKQAQLQRDYTLAHAPSGAGYTAASLATNLAVSAADPLNVAASFVPVVGETRAALWADRFGSTLARVGQGAIEGGVGAAAIQPIEAARDNAFQQQYGALDAFQNVAFGSALGGGLHAGFGKISDWLGGASPETREAALRSAVAQQAEGRPVDVSAALASDPATSAGYGAEFDTLSRAPTGDTEPPVTDTPVSADAAPAVTSPAVSLEENQPSDQDAFTTSKGSTYTLHDDGTTTRDKSFHPEHGEQDQGPQPRSQATIFVTADDANKLGEIQTQGGASKTLAQRSDGSWGVKYADGPDAGKFERRTVVTPQTGPAVGLTPVEIWNDGKTVHFGNEITSVSKAAQTTNASGYDQALDDVKLMSSKAPTDTTIMKAIRQNGGIRTRDADGNLTPAGGDLMSTIGDNPGHVMNTVNNSSPLDGSGKVAGSAPDAMTERLKEQGWLHPDADQNDLLDAIDRSTNGGEKIYHPESDVYSQIAYRDLLGREFDQAGIDASDSPEEAAAKLTQFRQKEGERFAVAGNEAVDRLESGLSTEARKALQSDDDWIGSDEWVAREQRGFGPSDDDAQASGGAQASDADDGPLGAGFGGRAADDGEASGARSVSAKFGDALDDVKTASEKFGRNQEPSTLAPPDAGDKAEAQVSRGQGDNIDDEIATAEQRVADYQKQGVLSDDAVKAAAEASAADEKSAQSQSEAAKAAARCLFLHP